MRMCPTCKAELRKRTFKGVEVDECENCHGLFFDRGELERVKNEIDPDVRWLDFVLFDAKHGSGHAGEKDCPKCSIAMKHQAFAGSEIVIDTCPNCKGVWLDHKELQKLIVYLESLIVHMDTDSLADHTKQQLVDVLVGPKGEIEELKDLLAVLRLLEERWASEHPKIAQVLETYYELTPFK